MRPLFICLVALAMASCAAGAGSTGSGSCANDNDCKGERICKSGKCIDPASDASTSTKDSSVSTSGGLVGAWYGSGPDFPDGDLCMIFCGDGHFFSGDRACSDTEASDFDCYRAYSVNGSQITAPFGTMTLIEVTTEKLTVEVPGKGTYTFARVEASPLCDSGARPECLDPD